MVRSTGCAHPEMPAGMSSGARGTPSSFSPISSRSSTWLVAPTSTSARPASFRPEVEINGRTTRVLAEQTAAVDPGRLGDSLGHLTFDELRQVEAALRLVLDL